MANTNWGGEIFPGFDCTTGEAIGYTGAEWQYRTKRMKLVHDKYTQRTRVYEDGKLRYEIMGWKPT